MIITRLTGGLGNQMFQYAFARKLAMERGVRLKLDISGYKKQSLRSYQLDDFRVSAEIASEEDVKKITQLGWSGFPLKVFQTIQWRVPYYLRRTVREQSLLFDPVIAKKTPRNAYLIGYWQSEKYFNSIRALLKEEFTLKNPSSPHFLLWKERISGAQSISLHIRRGDYVNNPHINQIHGVCSLSYYTDAIFYIRQRFPNTIIFVFSDDLDWAKKYLASYSPIEFVEHEGKNQDHEDILLMSLCNHHIIANSSFSWWGAWLSSKDHKTVIAPKKWFNDPNLNDRDIVPASWVKI